MFALLVSRTDAVYQRWLASITGNVDAGLVTVYCLEDLPERHTTYGIDEWLSGYLMIGQEGGRGVFLKCDGGGGPVFWADLGSRSEVDLRVLAPTFEVWLHSGFALPPDPEPEMPLIADVYVDRVPVDAVRLLAQIRKLLRADLRIGDFRGLLAAQPFVAARSAHPWVLRRGLELAPELRPYVYYATDHGLEAVWPPDSQ